MTRICLPTARRFKKKAFNCGHYEAQDVLREIADVELIELDVSPGYEFKEALQRRLLYRDITRHLIFRNPGLKKVRLKKDYDLFLGLCQTQHDILSLNAIEGWRDHCGVSAIWLDELWVANLPRYKYWIHILNEFDYVFVGYESTVEELSRVLGRQCFWLPGGVDALRFTPYPYPPSRVIDVYSIGRRREAIHGALHSWARTQKRLYVYDTSNGSFLEVIDYRQHREMFANLAKRSRYFMVAPGKVDSPSETEGQVEVGFRYYEAAASGAVMIGQRPNCRSFKQMFPWDEPVVEVSPDGSDVIDILTCLDSDPDRIAKISQDNATGALMHHDWVYRWKQLLQTVGFPSLPGIAERELRLDQLVNEVLSRASGKDRIPLSPSLEQKSL